MNKTMFLTALFAAIFTTISLKFLHFFNFIHWSPIGWLKFWTGKGWMNEYGKWALLFLVLFVVCLVFYAISKWTTAIPPMVTAIAISLIITAAVDWTIGMPHTLKEGIKAFSIPFFSINAIVSLFIIGTAVYMKKLSADQQK